MPELDGSESRDISLLYELLAPTHDTFIIGRLVCEYSWRGKSRAVDQAVGDELVAQKMLSHKGCVCFAQDM
jgi:hypothetical protein